jgi:hypothetical protein
MPDNTLSRAAWFVEDWIGIVEMMGVQDAELTAQLAEARELVPRLKQMGAHIEKAQEHEGADSAAAIISSMMRDWKVVGSVWYSPQSRRFRLTGEGYQAPDGDVFVGAYLPDADTQALARDFAAAMARED